MSVSLCAFVRVGEVEIKISRLFAFFLQRRDCIFVCYDSIFLKPGHHCDRASILISLSLKTSFFCFFLQPPGSLFVTLLVVSVLLFLFSLCCSPAVFFFDLSFLLLLSYDLLEV